MTTAFLYHRVSTNVQETKEQVIGNREYAKENGIGVLNEYGDYGKRHHAHKRPAFQQMLADIETMKPNMILVHRLDRFGVKDAKELGHFLYLLDQHKVSLITTIDGKDHNNDDIATTITNAIEASQSRQEQIDKSERVLGGKRDTASKGDFIGGKYLAYGFDLVCKDKDGNERWRLVDESYDCRIKYILIDGKYVEVQRYGNEVVKDPDRIMPDKIIRYRPRKERGERLMCLPSMREERVATLKRICEWFADGWTTHRIANQLNSDGIRPVYSDYWYPPLIDGLLSNPLLIGMPSWNRTSQSGFKHLTGGKIVATDKDQRWKWREQKAEDVVRPENPIFEPIIPIELWEKIQGMLEARKQSTPKRSPRNEQLWFGGLFVCGTTKQKLAGNATLKYLRVNHPQHHGKRLTFKQAEWFITKWLEVVGKRIEVAGDAVANNGLLKKLKTDEWLTELHFEGIRLEIENFLAAKLGEGHHTVGSTDVIIVRDENDGSYCIDTNGDYIELYCEMIKDDLEANRQAVQDWMRERDRLTVELIAMKGKTPYIIDAYNKQIAEYSRQIDEATDPFDYKRWFEQVQDELAVIRQKQEQVKQAIVKGEPLRKAQAVRQLIDYIIVEWGTEPSKDRRHKNGIRTYVKGVRVVGMDGEETTIITNETPSA
jgi:DNA invertase Pin-like site-specific DNA recombinase